MTVIENYPAMRPSLMLDFANSRRVHPLIQCLRASTATCFGADGKLRTVESNVPRIDHDPLTGKCLGMLIEEGRTNLILQSNSFSNALWNKSAPITVTPEADDWWDISHNGTGHYAGIYQAGRPNTSKVATFSFDIKPGSLTSASMFLGFNGTADAARVFFDFAAGTSAIGSLVGVITAAMVTHSLKNMGDYWRCTLSVDVSSTSIVPVSNVCYLYTGGVVSMQVAGNIKARRGQLESATFPTSYIETAAATVTRAADVITLPGVTITPAWTVVSEQTMAGFPGFATLWSIDSPSAGVQSNVRLLSTSAGNNRPEYSENGSSNNITWLNIATGTERARRAALASNGSTLRMAINGVVTGDGAAATKVQAAPNLRFGLPANSSFGFTGWMARLAIYPAMLSAAQIRRLTA